MHITESSLIKFEGNSTVTFDSNEASNQGTGDGGAVYIEDHSTVCYLKKIPATVKFLSNDASNHVLSI